MFIQFDGLTKPSWIYKLSAYLLEEQDSQLNQGYTERVFKICRDDFLPMIARISEEYPVIIQYLNNGNLSIDVYDGYRE
jgi:hypothetical protein